MNRKVFKARRTAKSYVFSQIRLIQTTVESFEYTCRADFHTFALYIVVQCDDCGYQNIQQSDIQSTCPR